MVALGVALAVVASMTARPDVIGGVAKADPMLMMLAAGLITGAVGMSLPGQVKRDPLSRTRAEDPPEGKPSGR